MSTARASVFTALRVALGVALLAYVLSATTTWPGLDRLAGALWILPVLALLSLVSTAIEALQLRLLCRAQRIRLSFAQGYRLAAIGVFFNFCVPGGTGGDVVKLYYLAADNRGRGVEAATVLFVARSVGLFGLLALIVVLALMNGQLLREQSVIGWLVAMATAGLAGLLGLLVLSAMPRERFSSRLCTARLPLARHVSRVVAALAAFHAQRSALLRAVGFALAGHCVMAVSFALIAAAIKLPAPLTLIWLLAFLGMLANALPVTPGGLGVGEAAFGQLFRLAGMDGGPLLLLGWRFGLLPLCALGAVLYITGARSPKEAPTDVVAGVGDRRRSAVPAPPGG